VTGSRADRKFLRKVIKFPLRLRVISGAQCPSGEVPGIAGTATSFSVGGIGFETVLPLAVRDFVQIAFILPGETRQLLIEATVQSVRATERKKSGSALKNVGVKFRNLTPQISVYLTNYMSGTFLLY